MLISYTVTQIEKPAGRSTKSKPKCLKFSLLLINLISPTSLLDCNKSNSIKKILNHPFYACATPSGVWVITFLSIIYFDLLANFYFVMKYLH